jgi:hypothetical protein
VRAESAPKTPQVTTLNQSAIAGRGPRAGSRYFRTRPEGADRTCPRQWPARAPVIVLSGVHPAKPHPRAN